MEYVVAPFTYAAQSRPFQWTLNKIRSVTYPALYGKWEATRMFTEGETVDYNIWLGSLESACDREALRRHNIHRIVTAVYDINPIFEDDPELTYLKVPVIDSPDVKISKHFDRAIEFIKEGASGKNKGKGVLVHCVKGVSRSSTLICAFLMKTQNWSVAKAAALHYSFMTDIG